MKERLRTFATVFVKFMLVAWAGLFAVGVLKAYLGGHDGLIINMNSKGEILFEVLFLIGLCVSASYLFVKETVMDYRRGNRHEF